MTLTLPEDLRLKLKEPLGDFLADLGELKNKTLICVGDQASKDVLAYGLKPKLCVYDGKINRIEVEIPAEIKNHDALELRVSNQPGTLSNEVFNAVEKALTSETNHKLMVDGEEDLVTLVAIKYASNGSLVLYGQPGEGLVLVEVNDVKKREIDSILDGMVEDGR